MSDHLIAEANRHAKALPKMTLPTTKPNDLDLAWYRRECELLQDRNEALEREIAALRAAIEESEEFARKNGETCGSKIRELLRENAALREDKERLDWIAKNRSVSVTERPLAVTPDSLRASIDAARKEAQI